MNEMNPHVVCGGFHRVSNCDISIPNPPPPNQQAFGKALKAATAEIEALKAEVAEGKLVANFGAKADAICNTVRVFF